MRKLSEINESIWRDTIVRNAEGRVRTENSIELKLRDFCDRHQNEELDKYQRKYEDFTITSDDKVDCSKDVVIYTDDLVNGKLPFKFGEVKGRFDCSSINTLTSLEGCPEEVGEHFFCTNCQALKSLEGCPKEVGKSFGCSGCLSLKSLDGCPKEVDEHFFCISCGRKFTEQEVRQHCNVTGEIKV